MSDSLVLARRTVTKMLRNPEQFIDVTLQPIIMTVLFVFIFGGAVAGSTGDYLQFALPGIIDADDHVHGFMTIQGEPQHRSSRTVCSTGSTPCRSAVRAACSAPCSATSCGAASRSA